jgi:hypothetical protein
LKRRILKDLLFPGFRVFARNDEFPPIQVLPCGAAFKGPLCVPCGKLVFAAFKGTEIASARWVPWQ